MTPKLNVAVVGCGYWGPNLIRNFHQIRDVGTVTAVDLDPARLDRMRELYPDIPVSDDVGTVLADPNVDAVAVALPVRLHHSVGVRALEAGKHLFVEKPLAATVAEGEAMIELADRSGLTLMVGHVFEFTEAVRRIKSLIDSKELGDLHYIHSQRLNLGRFQPDINVIWDLAPHDISILLYVLGGCTPSWVRANGASHLSPPLEDVAQVCLEFEGGPTAFLQFSWLDPKKVRQTVFVGSERMLVYDDIEVNAKLWLYDCGVEVPDAHETYDQFPLTYRYGDITIPRIGGGEPLREQVHHFIECCRYGKTPLTDGRSGLKVLKVLEATSRSIAAGGVRVPLEDRGGLEEGAAA